MASVATAETAVGSVISAIIVRWGRRRRRGPRVGREYEGRAHRQHSHALRTVTVTVACRVAVEASCGVFYWPNEKSKRTKGSHVPITYYERGATLKSCLFIVSVGVAVGVGRSRWR